MNEVLHANIFFLIASIATIVFAVMVCVAMYYVIKILASIQAIVARVEAGSDVIAEDISAMREFVAGGGLVSSVLGLFAPKRTTTRRRKVAEDVEQS
ncbi:MAG: hypothetical protein RLZZ70_689 [Candidatus Parcubacteria bacterium]